MSIVTPEKELSEIVKRTTVRDRIFLFRYWITSLIWLGVGMYSVTRVLDKQSRTNELVLEIRSAQDKATEQNQQWHTLMEADLATLKVRVAILESKMEEQQNSKTHQ